MAQKLNFEKNTGGDIRFTKVTGAGNDFILFDALNHVIPMLSQETIQRLCMRGLSIGADGLLILSPSQKADFKLHYYNADGSSGMLCANGARCAILYAKKFFDIIENKISFECCGKLFEGEIVDSKNIKFKLDDVKIAERTTILYKDKEIEIFVTNTGAPHAVLDFGKFAETFNVTEKFEDFDVNKIGAKIRNNPAFAPDGINVNFITTENGVVKIRTFEKGVERETLACGTGIVAAAVYLAESANANEPLEFISKSEKRFVVNFKKEENVYKEIYLTGETEIVYYGEIIKDRIY